MREVKQAIRSLARRRGMTFAVLVTLALGIGVNIAIFSVVDTVLIRPLPFSHAERIILIGGVPFSLSDGPRAAATFLDWSAQARSFEQIGAYYSAGGGVNLAGGSAEPEHVRATEVTPN